MPQTNQPQRHGSRIRVSTDWDNPQAFALCDGCQLLTYRKDLTEQMDYRGGMSPVPTGYLVCPKCYDTPNAQLMPPILKPDPVPTYLPRPDDSGTFWLLTEDGIPIATESDLTKLEIT